MSKEVSTLAATRSTDEASPIHSSHPSSPRGRRFLYRWQIFRRQPVILLSLLLTVVLLYLVVGPLVSILSDGVHVHSGDSSDARAPEGSLTSYYLYRLFRSPVASRLFWHPLANTGVVAVGTILFSLIVGGSMAWLVVRTNMWGRKWLSTALVVPYMLPSWTFSLAWLSIFKNDKAGGQVGLLQARGVNTPDWIAYGAFPIVICLGVHYAPFILLLFGNALRRLDSQLEDSARILGARGLTIARRVILPLMLPSLSSGTLLVFGRVLGTFGTPYILGLPTDYSLLSTSLYRSVLNSAKGQTAVFTAAIVVLGVGAVMLDSWLVRNQRRFVTVGSKGAMDRRTDLGRYHFIALGSALVVFVASVVIPLGTLFLTTISKIPGIFSSTNFTIRYWFAKHISGVVGFPHGVFRGHELYKAAWNSLWIVGITAIVCGIVGMLLGYVVTRAGNSRISSFLRQISFLPYMIPGIAFAAASLSLFAVSRGPIPALYGTSTLLIIVMVVTHVPYSARSGISAMSQLGNDPEDAAQVCGARWTTRIVRVVFPIQRGPFIAGIILPFISGIKELSVVVMLVTGGTQLLTTLSIDLIDDGYEQMSNAVVLLLAVISFAVTYSMQKVTKTTLAAGLGG